MLEARSSFVNIYSFEKLGCDELYFFNNVKIVVK